MVTKTIRAGCARRQGVRHSLGAQLWGRGAWACVVGRFKHLWLQVVLNALSSVRMRTYSKKGVNTVETSKTSFW